LVDFEIVKVHLSQQRERGERPALSAFGKVAVVSLSNFNARRALFAARLLAEELLLLRWKVGARSRRSHVFGGWKVQQETIVNGKVGRFGQSGPVGIK
jgi:hypothetical protein